MEPNRHVALNRPASTQRRPLVGPHLPAREALVEPVWQEADAPARLTRLLIRGDGRLLMLRLENVDWIEGEGNYVRLHAGGAGHRYRETLSHLEQRLDPERFVRIHRSAIVNLDRVRELRPTASGCYRVLLTNGVELSLSRGYRRRVLARAGRS
jgi:two-component system LytT family response regulator